MKRYAIIMNIHSDGGNVSRYWMRCYNGGKYHWAGTAQKFLYSKWSTAYDRLEHLKSTNTNSNVNYQILDYETPNKK